MAGHSPVVNIRSSDELYVMRISDDPWVPFNKIRQICADLDFAVNF